ncbi:Histone transcription regulator [Wickerhamomyces ciferrii]|uniref:Histone transcription regulator n=1 Tax=Wickerhamomyces ciferrii (strain ATCC 14091 / BCRC 22168 / CBS 111 / JCM 3599 / NBRC 0793 / NRRL Y-1031 F-60-10) TaxID=1206466 RepID=K0KHS1_WICCF|nr:Histone transcription regulator [Wickerhamomyces ciferrii]CCH42561.1 Histone transcription regulator [Wickerhamomyces ciferrii]
MSGNETTLEQSNRRLKANEFQTIVPAAKSSTITNVPLTKSHFLDAYSKGKWNLSKVPCPSCFEGVDLISPPEHYNEALRQKVVKKFVNSEQWKDRETFNKLISKALKAFHVKGASISIIDGNRQLVKYQSSLNISECPRRLAIDSHTILSTGNFVLLDASKDWRTARNPFVTNVPFIKFYAGVPLITKFGVVIGAISVFDPFPRVEFEKKQIEALKELAGEVMAILCSPVKKDSSTTTSSIPLINLIGRPTSQGSQLSSTAVYEKDGSGSPYSQNHNFRYSKHDALASHDSLINDKIWKQLSHIRDMKLASSLLSKIITDHLKFDLACIVEIKVSQKYQISSEIFPNENKIEAETFKFADKLSRVDNEEIQTRVLGSFGYKASDLTFGSDLYYGALSSEFGKFYESTNNNAKFRSGICMPFYRIPSKLVRKRKIVRNDKSSKTKPIEVYLRSGGYLISVFDEKEREIPEKEMNYIYGAACTLRSFKVFQKALKSQKISLFDEARIAYDELYKIEVITGELNINAASPTVKTLRYLAYRNRGLLYFDELKSKISNISIEESLGLMLDSLDDLAEALQYNEGDDIVIDLLLSLFDFFGNDRLSRFLIEYQITKEETDEFYLHRRTKLDSPNFLYYLQAERLLLKKLGTSKCAEDFKEELIPHKSLEDVSFLEPLRSYMISRKEQNLKGHIKTITLDEINWKNIAVKLQNVVPRSKQRISRFKDSYRLDNKTYEVLRFKFATEDASSEVERGDEPNFEHVIQTNDAGAESEKGSPLVNDKCIEDLSKNNVTGSLEKESEDVKINDDFDGDNMDIDPTGVGEDKIDTDATGVEDKVNIDTTGDPGDNSHEISREREPKIEDVRNDITISDVPEKRPLGEPQPQRSSKRVRHQAEPESHANKVDEFDIFLMNFHNYLSAETITSRVTSRTILDSGLNDLHYIDLEYCLQNWTLRFAELLASQNEKSQSGLALNELINTNIVNSSLSSDTEVKEIDNEIAIDFISEVNDNNFHFIETKYSFFKYLLGESDGVYPIINKYLDKELFSSVESLVLSSESDYFLDISKGTDNGMVAIGVATLEILVNHWISLKQKLKGKGGSQKSNSELVFQISQLEAPIERWRHALTTLLLTKTNSVLLMRFRWCCILYLQHGELVSLPCLKQLLGDLYVDFEKVLNGSTIEFPNYEAIPTLNPKMIKNQSDKLNVLDIFEKTFKEGGDTNEDANKLLENVLLGLTKRISEEEISMDQFVSGSSITLKLKLWKILLDSYITLGDLDKYIKAMEVVLPLLLSQLEDDAYKKQSDTQRYQTLLSTLGFYSDYTEGFVSILERNLWKINEPNNVISRNIFHFLKIFFFYILKEFYDKPSSAKPFSEIAPKSSSKFQDIITNSFIILFIFESTYQQESSEDKYDMFSIVHIQLGHLGFCDAASGNFLRLSEHLWKNADFEIYESDILQHLDCRFHISISNERFTPYEHDTEEISLDRESAITFTPCLMNLVHRKRDNVNSILKPDLKSAIDTFADAIGEPDLSIPIIQKNDSALTQFLESELDVLFFRKAFAGALDIDLKRGFSSEQIVADQGLFYSQAVNNLNIYKMRKKAMQSAVSELDDVYKMIKTDLLYGSRRSESWFILGQVFTLQVEDDLVWTSDKLNVFERKLGTASSQRKSILCFLMSLSLCAQDQLDGVYIKKEFLTSVLSTLSQTIFNSLSSPMSALCFKVQDDKRLLKSDGISSFLQDVVQTNTKHLFNANLQIIRLAVKNDPTNWQNHYYSAKVLHKMNYPAKRVLQSCIDSCLVSSNAIEPHYLLLTMTYKYFKQGKITGNAAFQYLKKVNPFLGLASEQLNETKISIDDMIISGLKKINQIDKKKWHHKHRYRLSRIYFDVGNADLAYQEIEALIVLKSTNKNLVSIWKPEFEPPGKHFVYTYTYILYYIKLINHFADFHKLLLFTKKLRRYGSGMVNLVEAWDFSCLTLCLLTKEIIGAEPGFTDIEVPKLVYIEFVQGSQSLTNKFKKETLNDEQKRQFTLLYEISEIRRMNNGFGSTSQLDDTFNAIYLKVYLEYITSETKHLFINENTLSSIKPSSTPIKTKVARRDILAAATSLVKAVESKLSDNKITDDRGFVVPDHIKQKHLENSTLKSDSIDKVEMPLTGDDQDAVKISSVPESKNNHEVLKSNCESEEEFHTPTDLTFDGDEVINSNANDNIKSTKEG